MNSINPRPDTCQWKTYDKQANQTTAGYTKVCQLKHIRAQSVYTNCQYIPNKLHS